MRWISCACTLALAIAVAPTDASANADKGSEQQVEDMARVTITLADKTGGQMSMVDLPVRWSETAVLTAKVGEHEHRVQLTVQPPGDDKSSVKVLLKYAKDGKTVIQEKDLGARVTEPKRVESADGQAAVTFVVQLPRGKIEVDTSNDPLAGS